MKNLLSIESLSAETIRLILADAAALKRNRRTDPQGPLAGQYWAMLFSKSSTRTRVSFEVGIRELGGQVVFLPANEIHLGRGEPIKDTGRVLGRMVHGAVIRTFAQKDVEEFAKYSGLPTINALTDEEHPCQILADLLTFEENRGSIENKTVVFIGDAACNVANSWSFAAGKLNFKLRLIGPKSFWPSPELLRRAGGNVSCSDDVAAGVGGADLIYTDVWVSMGKEAESAERTAIFQNYQVNQPLLQQAKRDALVMHCLPAYRGKEIAEDTFEKNADTIFTQAENRLHTQKAVLKWIVS
jgi:ornithine carbamoyltransferase